MRTTEVPTQSNSESPTDLMHPKSLAAYPSLFSGDLAVRWRVEGEAEMEGPSPGDQIV